MGVRDEFKSKIQLAVEDVNSSPSEDGGKIDKALVNYRVAEDPRVRCGTCNMFESPGSCSLVSGVINPEGVCDRWEAVNTGSGGWSEKSKDLEPSEKMPSTDHEMAAYWVSLMEVQPFWRSWYAQFDNDCHNPGGEGGGEFCSGSGGGASSPSDRLATAKPQGAGSDYTPENGKGIRMGLGLLSEDQKVKIVDRQRQVSGFEDIGSGSQGDHPANGKESDVDSEIKEIVDRQAKNIEDYAAAVIGANPAKAAATADWYPYANGYIKGLANDNGVSEKGALAATAALSASAAWTSNVPWAKFLIENLGTEGQKQIVPKEWAAAAYASALAAYNKKTDAGTKSAKPDIDEFMGVVGKKIGDLSDREVAISLRGKHEAGAVAAKEANPNIKPGQLAGYKAVTQLGDEVHAGFGTKGAGTVPQSFDNIEKAVSVLRDPTDSKIDKAIGNENKVRSFYANLSDPKNKGGFDDVTIDTHNYGVSNGAPWTVNSPFISSGPKNITSTPGNSATGAKGSYVLSVEATRQATISINKRFNTSYSPAQIQSITWEHHKSTFEPKTRSNKTMIAEINAAHTNRALGHIDKGKEASLIETARVKGGNRPMKEIQEAYKRGEG